MSDPLPARLRSALTLAFFGLRCASSVRYTAFNLQGHFQSPTSECIDTPDWKNPDGLTCTGDVSYESKGYCSCPEGKACQPVIQSQEVDFEFAMGEKNNFPENNCCICGKGKTVPLDKLPELVAIPVSENHASRPRKLVDAIAFYAPGPASQVTEWDRRTGGSAFANFWPLNPETITVTHNGVSGTFYNAEAAYHAMKWWQDDWVREQMAACDRPTLTAGAFSWRLSRQFQKNESLKEIYATDYDGLGKYEAMLVVLRQKFRIPALKKYLLSTAGMYLDEHAEVTGRDLFWTDDGGEGDGENRLGLALMTVRSELMKEAGMDSDGWPEGVDRPSWEGGGENSNWMYVSKVVGRALTEASKEMPLSR